METIGQRLRRLREERGYAQRDVAGPGVSPAYISLIERERREPSIKALRVLARNLGVSVEYLETGCTLRDADSRSMRLLDAELRLRLVDDPAEVEQEFRELHWEAVEAGDSHSATRALIGLGLVAAHRGAHREVVKRLGRAINDPWVSVLSHSDVFVTLARSHCEIFEFDEAIDLLTHCWDIAREAESGGAVYIKFASYLACALNDVGERDRAQSVLHEAGALVDSSVDRQARVRLLWSQARLAGDSGNTSAALEGMYRAIGLLEATENEVSLGRAHLVCGEILLTDDRLAEAQAHLSKAELLLGGRAEAQDRAVLLAEQAKLAARSGDGSLAIGLARRALDVLGDDDPPEQSRAYWALAEGLGACGQLDEADRAFSRAAELLGTDIRYKEQLTKARERVLAGVTSARTHPL